MKRTLVAVAVLVGLLLVLAVTAMGQGPQGPRPRRFAQGMGNGPGMGQGMGQGMGMGSGQMPGAAGQMPHTPGAPPDPQQMVQNRVNRLARLLSLTDAQKSQATAIFTAVMQAGQPLQQNLRTARTALRDAVKTNNAAQIDQQALVIGNLAAQVTAIHAKGDAQFLAILTAEQQAKLPPGGLFGGPGMGRRGPGMGPGPAGRRGPGMGPAAMRMHRQVQ